MSDVPASNEMLYDFFAFFKEKRLSPVACLQPTQVYLEA